ncbi:DUF2514 family protein [Mesosutterella sp. AGMB02718]|uniref:DUF2514 family protein n=1 Tax=Mesosutterella faecium TaxID=2925194 RepID=A0ABT7IJ16_9BURK|nr:DUF2514 family protein [Mesosutterella sp. AGMB02718]MDL2058376.1 DUF2514 family protein [Mesosutterella sp. AGMB02718]
MTKLTLLKILAFIAYIVTLFAAGYQYGHQKTAAAYEAQIAKDRAAQAEAAQKLETEYREKENENAKRVATALAARDKALADAGAVRADAVRLRQSTKDLSTQLSRAAASHAAAGDSSSERLGKCEDLLAESAALLGESVDLAAEGAGLSTKIAADKDTILKAVH